MSGTLVLGNGESRKGLDLGRIYPNYEIVGCNAVHRDMSVDHLVCCDRRMVQEAVNNAFEDPVYTRSDWYKQFSFWRNVRCLPELPYKGNKRQDDPWHWGSGGHALNLACTMDPDYVVMLGFDLWGSNSKFNNIYKSTENYNDATKPATDPSYWVYQTAKLFEVHSKIKFLQIQPDDWDPPEEWDQFGNFFIDNYENLQILIDKNK